MTRQNLWKRAMASLKRETAGDYTGNPMPYAERCRENDYRNRLIERMTKRDRGSKKFVHRADPLPETEPV